MSLTEDATIRVKVLVANHVEIVDGKIEMVSLCKMCLGTLKDIIMAILVNDLDIVCLLVEELALKGITIEQFIEGAPK